MICRHEQLMTILDIESCKASTQCADSSCLPSPKLKQNFEQAKGYNVGRRNFTYIMEMVGKFSAHNVSQIFHKLHYIVWEWHKAETI